MKDSLYYFDGSQEAGQDISQWNKKQQEDLFNKLKELSKNTKKYWLNTRCGSGGLKRLAVYGNFPINTDFKCPKNIPDNVSWARFRMDNMMRIVVFFLNEEESKARCLSSDVFYIVFLDKDHRFYKTEEK